MHKLSILVLTGLLYLISFPALSSAIDAEEIAALQTAWGDVSTVCTSGGRVVTALNCDAGNHVYFVYFYSGGTSFTNSWSVLTNVTTFYTTGAWSDINGLALMNKVQTLALIKFGATVFPSLAPMAGVTVLSLGEIRTTTFNATILSGMPSLETLYIQNSDLTEIPSLSHLPKLVSAYLTNNRFTGASESIFTDLPSLKRIDLSINPDLRKLPSSWIHLPSLGYLNLPVCGLNLPDSLPTFFNNNTIVNIDLSSNNIVTLPDGICALKQLTNLFVTNNELTSFPSCFSEIVALREVFAVNNKFHAFPEFMLGNPFLTSIRLSDNPIGSIPTEFWALPALADVYCSNCSLNGTLPSFSGLLTDLVNLELSMNQLSGTLPNDTFSSTIKLTSLHLAGNNFEGALPSSLGSSPVLNQVLVAGNRFNSIPESILTNPNQLQNLDVSDNGLLSLPSDDKWLLKSQGLGEVYLANNPRLADRPLPTFWKNMNDLSTFSIAGCFLTGEIPRVITSPALGFLDLSNNRLTGDLNIQPNEQLYIFNVSRNRLSGGFLNNLPTWSNLGSLDISFNLLTGSLPKELELLNLEVLYINNNAFVGNLSAVDQPISQINFSTNFLDLCAYRPSSLYDSTQPEACDVSQNRYPGTCFCESWYSAWCQVDTTADCPTPSTPIPSFDGPINAPVPDVAGPITPVAPETPISPSEGPLSPTAGPISPPAPGTAPAGSNPSPTSSASRVLTFAYPTVSILIVFSLLL